MTEFVVLGGGPGRPLGPHGEQGTWRGGAAQGHSQAEGVQAGWCSRAVYPRGAGSPQCSGYPSPTHLFPQLQDPLRVSLALSLLPALPGAWWGGGMGQSAPEETWVPRRMRGLRPPARRAGKKARALRQEPVTRR